MWFTPTDPPTLAAVNCIKLLIRSLPTAVPLQIYATTESWCFITFKLQTILVVYVTHKFLKIFSNHFAVACAWFHHSLVRV